MVRVKSESSQDVMLLGYKRTFAFALAAVFPRTTDPNITTVHGNFRWSFFPAVAFVSRKSLLTTEGMHA